MDALGLSDDPALDEYGYDRVDLPAGVETRPEAIREMVGQLDRQTDIDLLPVLQALLSGAGQRASQFSETDDVLRALRRERRLMRSNAREDRPGGRPSKVNRLSQEIGSSIGCWERGDYGRDRRDELIRDALGQADISRATYYRLRGRVKTQHDLDLSEIRGVPGHYI